jgi:hypothetical protein
MAAARPLSEFVAMFTATALLGTALFASPYGVPVPGTTDVPVGLRAEFRQKQLRDLARIEEDLAFVRSMLDISREWADASARSHVERWKEHEAKLTGSKRALLRSWIP